MSLRPFFLTGLLAALAWAPAHAQTTTTTTTEQTTTTAGQGRMMGRQAEMMKELNLSADQQTKITALMSANPPMARPTGPPTDAERQAMQTRRADMEAKMKEILTPEQYTKYQAMRPQRGQRPQSN